MIVGINGNKEHAIDIYQIAEITPECDRVLIKLKDDSYEGFDKLIIK